MSGSGAKILTTTHIVIICHRQTTASELLSSATRQQSSHCVSSKQVLQKLKLAKPNKKKSRTDTTGQSLV
jgi:hypothetical protein